MHVGQKQLFRFSFFQVFGALCNIKFIGTPLSISDCAFCISLKTSNSNGLLKLLKDTVRRSACSMMTYRLVLGLSKDLIIHQHPRIFMPMLFFAGNCRCCIGWITWNCQSTRSFIIRVRKPKNSRCWSWKVVQNSNFSEYQDEPLPTTCYGHPKQNLLAITLSVQVLVLLTWLIRRLQE